MQQRLQEMEEEMLQFLISQADKVDSFEVRKRFRALELLLHPDSMPSIADGPNIGYFRNHKDVLEGWSTFSLRRVRNDRFDLDFDQLREVRLHTLQFLGLLKIATVQKEGDACLRVLPPLMKNLFRMGSRHMYSLTVEIFHFFKSHPRSLFSQVMYEQFRGYTIEWLRNMDREILRKNEAYGKELR